MQPAKSEVNLWMRGIFINHFPANNEDDDEGKQPGPDLC